MGVHLINLNFISPELDPAKPQVLIYEPVGDELRLVAAEWFVPVEVAGETRPSIFGKELQGPMEGHKPLMPAGAHHFDLHVWLWKSNPAGVFSPTNPALKCPADGYLFAETLPSWCHTESTRGTERFRDFGIAGVRECGIRTISCQPTAHSQWPIAHSP